MGEWGSARWRSLGEALTLREAAATPPEGVEQHQWSVRRERHARTHAVRYSPPETTDVLPLPQAAPPPLPSALALPQASASERFPIPPDCYPNLRRAPLDVNRVTGDA